MEIDGSAPPDAVAELVGLIDGQRPADQFKLRLIAAEQFLAVGDHVSAVRHADAVRYGRRPRPLRPLGRRRPRVCNKENAMMLRRPL